MSDQLAPDFELKMNGLRLPPEVERLVTSLVVTHEPNSLDHFTMDVANEFPKLPFTHGDRAGFFREGNGVKIKLGYVDATETVFDGEVTRVTTRFPADSIPVVTIEGHNLLHRLRGSTSTRTFQGVTDSDIAKKIAGENGLSAKVDATTTKHPYVMQAAQSDFDFLLERARRIRYELLADGRDLIFRKPADGGAAVCTLIWGDPQRAAQDGKKYLLHAFEATLDAMVPVGSVTVRGLDPIARELIEAKGGGGDEVDTSATTAAAAGEKAFQRKTHATVVDLPIATRAEGEEIAKALFNERSLRLVTGRGMCSGTPAIRAGTVVRLDGVGVRLVGSYFVIQSTHELGKNGYTTRFEVRRGVTG